MLSSADIGSMASFSVYPTGIIENPYVNVKILDILSPRTALVFADIVSLHTNVFPTLPIGSPSNYDDYSYVQIEHSNGSTQIIGLPWIIDATIVIHSNTQARIIVSDIVPADLPAIREALISNGFVNITATLV